MKRAFILSALLLAGFSVANGQETIRANSIGSHYPSILSLTDTAALKSWPYSLDSTGTYVWLDELAYGSGKSTGGMFVLRDSSLLENGGIAFDCAAPGKQWVRSRYSEDGIVNIKWFGSKGNGVTDNSILIQRAITFANNHSGELFVPIGTFVANGIHIETSTRMSIRGCGRGSVLKLTSADTCLIVDVGTGGSILMRDFEINMNTRSNSIGIYLDRTAITSNLENIWIFNVGDYSCGIETNDHDNVNNVVLKGIKIYGAWDTESDGFHISSDATSLFGCHFEGGSDTHRSSGTGFLLGNKSNMSSVGMFGCEAKSVAYGVRCDSVGVFCLTLSGMRIEGCDSAGIQIYGFDALTNRARGLYIINPYITRSARGIILDKIEGFNILSGMFKDLDSTCVTLGSTTTVGIIKNLIPFGTTASPYISGTIDNTVTIFENNVLSLGAISLTDSVCVGDGTWIYKVAEMVSGDSLNIITLLDTLRVPFRRISK